MKIEYLSAADRGELLDYLPSVFRRDTPDHPRFETLYPQLFPENDDAAMSRHAVIRENGRIVSCVGMYPMLLQVGGCRVTVAGIGQVSTAAGSLGRGFMSALLKHQLARAKDEGCAIAWLGGRRDRYSNFGFDCAGWSFSFSFDRRSTRAVPRVRAFSRAVAADPASITPAMWELRERTVEGVIEPLAFYRTRKDIANPATQIWTLAAEDGGAPAAWAVAVPAQRGVDFTEYCGAPDAVVELVAHAADVHGHVTCGASCDPAFSEPLREACFWCGCGTNMLAVLDPAAVAAAYAPVLGPGVAVPDASLGSMRLARIMFGPEHSAFPALPFRLPGLCHV